MDLAWLGGALGGDFITGEMLGGSSSAGTCECGLEVGSSRDVETSFTPDGAAAGMIIRYVQEEW